MYALRADCCTSAHGLFSLTIRNEARPDRDQCSGGREIVRRGHRTGLIAHDDARSAQRIDAAGRDADAKPPSACAMTRNGWLGSASACVRLPITESSRDALSARDCNADGGLAIFAT